MQTSGLMALLGMLAAFLIHAVFILVSIFFILDFIARRAEYFRCKDRLTHGSDDLDGLIERKRHTRCQREILIQAAKVVQQEEYVRSRYRDMGYKWYQILPDWAFTNPGNLISPAWWKSFMRLK